MRGSAGKVELQMSDKKIKTSELRYRRLFEAAQDGILILDAETGAIVDVNPFLIKMLGYTREEFVGRKLWEVGAFADIEASKEAFEVLQEKEYIRYEDLPLKAKDGQLVQVEFVSNVYLVGNEKVIQCNIRDITVRKAAQRQSETLLREKSVRDHLTGLFNRQYMEETLERELLRAGRNQLSLGIIMLDIDDFKQYNDIYGHAAGDAVLRELGRLLLNQVRRDDISSRYGGDEFIIVMPGASLEMTKARARLLSEHARHFKLEFEGQTLPAVTLSLGVAVFPAHGLTGPAILRSVDLALYRSKRKGRGLISVAGSLGD